MNDIIFFHFFLLLIIFVLISQSGDAKKLFRRGHSRVGRRGGKGLGGMGCPGGVRVRIPPRS